MDKTINFDIETVVDALKTKSDNGTIFEIEKKSVSRASFIAKDLNVKNSIDLLLTLCSLNLLNAAIKTDSFKGQLSYATIKGTAGKLVGVIDKLKDDNINYYYSVDEKCLYFKVCNVIFSFHQVPQTPELLKASFTKPIKWTGIRLQKIAQPLFENVMSHYDYNASDKCKQTFNLNKEDKIEIQGIVKANIEKFVSLADEYGWYDLVKLSPILQKAGLKKEKYRAQKVYLLLKEAFENSIEVNVQGTKALVKFNFQEKTVPHTQSKEKDQNEIEKKGCEKTILTNGGSSKNKLYDLGLVKPKSWEILSQLSGIRDISIKKNIDDFISEEPEYFNGAGFTKFPDDTLVSADTGKFILLRTSLKKIDGSQIVGWFIRDTREKDKTAYKGIIWGTYEEFKNSIKLAHKCIVGRMIFKDWDKCKQFFETLNNKVIPEPWSYTDQKETDFKYPILKSYLKFELDRLFYEQEILSLSDKILFNPEGNMILFNTNLINKYGDDLYIVGEKIVYNGKVCITDLEVAPSKSKLSKYGYKNETPNPPQFFEDINEIVFHCSWDIDDDMDKREHIIEERIERFPERYRNLKPNILGQTLNNAINFATKIAQRNYKFIVPMYYPTKQRIQLLMPIYLDNTYSNHPDFALVLTPDKEAQLYVPETILGLAEVYQDARLIAKPEESWLNPDIIKQDGAGESL